MKVLVFLFDLFGRARRRDFWLFLAGLTALYSYLWNLLRSTAGPGGDLSIADALLHNEVVFIALTLVQIATLAMLVRRLHDRNKSGLWLILAVVPVVGQAWLVWELGLMPGTDGINRYGVPPRAMTRSL